MGRLSNPIQRRLGTTDIDDLVAAYEEGAPVEQLAWRFGMHRSTVAGHPNRSGVERHDNSKAWADDVLAEAAAHYEAGESLATVAGRFSVDPSTVANRFRRAEITIRPRRGHP